MKFYLFFLFVVFGAVFSFDAYALSCMQPNIYRTFEQKKQSEESYMLVHGRFVKSVEKEHESDDNPSKQLPQFLQERRLPSSKLSLMTFHGEMIGDKAQNDRPLKDFVVEVQALCAAHWCGSLPKLDQEVITFFKMRGDDLPLLSVHACGGDVFNALSFDVEALRTCFDNDCSARHQHNIVPYPSAP